MPAVRPFPESGSIYVDSRGHGRAMRASWHHQDGPHGTVVLSLWREGICAATFRLDAEDVPGLVEMLAAGLREAMETTHLLGARSA